MDAVAERKLGKNLTGDGDFEPAIPLIPGL
jgi:hypothetical protein